MDNDFLTMKELIEKRNRFITFMCVYFAFLVLTVGFILSFVL